MHRISLATFAFLCILPPMIAAPAHAGGRTINTNGPKFRHLLVRAWFLDRIGVALSFPPGVADVVCARIDDEIFAKRLDTFRKSANPSRDIIAGLYNGISCAPFRITYRKTNRAQITIHAGDSLPQAEIEHMLDRAMNMTIDELAVPDGMVNFVAEVPGRGGAFISLPTGEQIMAVRQQYRSWKLTPAPECPSPAQPNAKCYTVDFIKWP